MSRGDRRAKTRFIYTKILDTLTCQICGEGHNATLDFHHIEPFEKKHSVSDMKSKDYSPDKMVEEMSKCACLCANCHRKHHYKEEGYLVKNLSKESKSRLSKVVKNALQDWKLSIKKKS